MNTEITPDELTARYQLLCRSTQVDAAKDPQTQQIEVHLQALNKLLTHDLRALARRGSPDDFADIYFALEQELERFHEFCSFPALAQKFVVAFGGGFSAGKSSLINTLLGKRLLVTEVDPTTSLPTYVLGGETDAVHAHNLFGHRIDLSNEEFLSLTHDEIERYGSNISRLLRSAVITRADFPWENLAIIDTPGYTKHEDQTQGARTDEHIARTQLNAAQAIVWVIDARKGCITEDDLQFLATVQADIPRLIVVSRADQKPADEISAIVQGIKATLSERNLPFVDVIAVSARQKQQKPVVPVLMQRTALSQQPHTLSFTENFKTKFTRYINPVAPSVKTTQPLPIVDVSQMPASPKQEEPVESILMQLTAWSRQPRVLRFAYNFKRQFTRYTRYLNECQRSNALHLNRLNSMLALADSVEVRQNAQELKADTLTEHQSLEASEKDLHALRQRFFFQLKYIGDIVGIPLPEPAGIDLIDIGGLDLLPLLQQIHKQSNSKEHDYRQHWQLLNAEEQLANLPFKLHDLANMQSEMPNLQEHLAANCDEHSRITYATLLAAVLLTGDQINAKQSHIFKLILGSLKLTDMQPFLFEGAMGLNENKLQDFFRVIAENHLSASFFIEALILCRLSGPLKESQHHLLSEFAELLELVESDLKCMAGLATIGLDLALPNGEDSLTTFFSLTVMVLGYPAQVNIPQNYELEKLSDWFPHLSRPLSVKKLASKELRGWWQINEPLQINTAWNIKNAYLQFSDKGIIRTETGGKISISKSRLEQPAIELKGYIPTETECEEAILKESKALDNNDFSCRAIETLDERRLEFTMEDCIIDSKYTNHQYLSALTLTEVYNAEISNTKVRTKYARAFLFLNSLVSLDECHFTDCGSFRNFGGAIAAKCKREDDHSNISIANSSFTRCIAKVGGGIRLSFLFKQTFDNVKFDSCLSEFHQTCINHGLPVLGNAFGGGAVFTNSTQISSDNNSDYHFSDCEFINTTVHLGNILPGRRWPPFLSCEFTESYVTYSNGSPDIASRSNMEKDELGKDFRENPVGILVQNSSESYSNDDWNE